ncbi:hypothetical protein ABTY59_31645 [Streptomyces sp. NPDC096079]|uniref:hypothetical protein n=1 Tax=Streptomyces sp. NPDC096079 TaxID=3155820 RepID=UPI0033176519
MTTQRTSRALAREAAGLCLTPLGVLGVLVALGSLHWAAGLSAAMGGVLAAAVLLPPQPDASRQAHVVRWAAGLTGYGGLTGCAFALCAPVGWIGVSLAVTAAGWWLATSQAVEGA